MAQSQQKQVGRVRPPRVQIEYEVFTGGAMKKTELPFVVGVMADLSGDGAANLPNLSERKFVEIDRDNINGRLKESGAEVNLRVKNTLAGDGSSLAVNLKFNSMDDFSPTNVANQVEPLKKLLEARKNLDYMLAKMASGKVSEEKIAAMMADADKVSELAKALGVKDEEPAPKEG